MNKAMNENSADSGSGRSSIPCVKCTDGNGDFFRLENTQLTGYCQICFGRIIRCKFASCMGRNRLFKNPVQRNTLLVYMPGQLMNSTHLLQFTDQSISEPDDHRKLRINPTILVLFDEFDQKKLDAQFQQCLNLTQKFKLFDRQWHFAHLASVVYGIERNSTSSDLDMDTSYRLEGKENLMKFEEFLASCKSSSYRAEICRLLRVHLIAKFAVNFNCPTVFLPENADFLAELAINLLCFGRGPSMCNLSHVAPLRFDGLNPNGISIQFVRPLRDISHRELEAMQKLDVKKQLEGEISENDQEKEEKPRKMLLENEETDGDVQRLTGKFINSLRNSGFPSTVSTILSVASKVEAETEGSCCILCFDHFQSELANEQSAEHRICTPCNNLIEELSEKNRQLLFDICFRNFLHISTHVFAC